MSWADLPPGTTVSGYVVERCVALGGMSAVYRATDSSTGRAVALKLLSRDNDRPGDRGRRLLEEAQALACLRHPRVVALYEMGEHQGCSFLAMEWIPGVTLAERLARGPLGETEALRLFTQVADGLSAAHSLGLAHRDLKPSNIMIGPGGEAKLVDFGLVKPIATEAELGRSWATVDGTLLGTPAYMAPEQARGEALTLASDAFSFGAVLYESLTGEPAFARESTFDTLNAVVDCDYPRFPRARSPVQRCLQSLARRCLSRDPAERPGDARELLVELRYISSGVRQRLGPGRRRTGRRYWGVAVAFGLLACAVALWRPGLRSDDASVPARGLVELSVNGMLPVLSSDGGWLISTSPDRREIWRSPLGAESGGSSMVWAGTESITSVALTPDGRSVLFAATDSASTSWVWELPVEGGVPRRVTPGCEPVVSADGHRLVVIERRAAQERRVVECLRDGTEHRVLAAFDGSATPVGCAYLGQDVVTVVTDGVRRSRLIRIAAGTGEHQELSAHHGVAEPGVAVAGEQRSVLWCVRPSGVATAMMLATSLGDGRTRALFAGPGLASRPSLSRDGSQVLFQVLEPRNELVEMSVDPLRSAPGAVLHRLPGSLGASQPRVSPDGSRLVYRSTRGDLWVMDRATGGTGPLLSTGEGSFNPAWSADGRWLAYSCIRGNRSALWIGRADGGSPRQVTDDDAYNSFQPVWHPDGRHLLYISDREGQEELYRLNVDSGEVVRLTRGGAANPAISPDGRRLAYSLGRDDGTAVLRLARLAPDLGALETEWERPVRVNWWAGAKSRFSPDGRWLAYDAPSGEAGADVWVVPVDGGLEAEPVQLTAFENPVGLLGWFDWVDDGRLILTVTESRARVLLLEDVGQWLEHLGVR